MHDVILAAAVLAMVFSPCLFSLFVRDHREDGRDAAHATNSSGR